MKVEILMRVSAIISTCDRPAEAANALASVLAQSRVPDEVIVVDDGLKDRFEIPTFADGAPDVRIIRTAGRQGACSARNAGAHAATGSILMFLDDDDTWETEKVEHQVEFFSDPSVVLVYTGRLAVDADDRTTVKYRIPAKRSGDLSTEILAQNVVGTTSCAAIRATAFQQAGGFDVQQPALNDYDLWIRLAQLGKIMADGAFNTRYTLSSKPLVSISTGPTERHRLAVHRIRYKYAGEYERLSWLARRRVFAGQSFYIAKNARLHGWKTALPYVLQAFCTYPHPKYLMILAPLTIRETLRRLLDRRIVSRSSEFKNST